MNTLIGYGLCALARMMVLAGESVIKTKVMQDQGLASRAVLTGGRFTTSPPSAGFLRSAWCRWHKAESPTI